jgi:hypothetical protein
VRSGFASSSDFSRAFKHTSGFRPRAFSRDRLIQVSKIRQDLLANAGYGRGKLPERWSPDRFRVRLVDRPAQRIAYERVIGSFDAARLLAALSAGTRSFGLLLACSTAARPLSRAGPRSR